MELVRIQPGAATCLDSLEALEQGNILFFPVSPFAVSEEDTGVLLGAGQADGNFHKNISFRPATGKLNGLGKAAPGEHEQVQRAMASYSRLSLEFLSSFLAPYRASWKMDYASFRSIEEQGRQLPLKKRNDLLHVDAFPTRPTNGGLILRFFTNVNPAKTRDWMTSDPFSQLAPRYADAAGLNRIAEFSQSPLRTYRAKAIQLAKAMGLPFVDRSPYDEFMLGFHDFLKLNEGYQRTSAKFQFRFPPGSSWMVFTDVAPHAVLAGRYALEQTVVVPRDSLLDPGKAPASILESLCGRKLTYPT